jgi:hypothetical protein
MSMWNRMKLDTYRRLNIMPTVAVLQDSEAILLSDFTPRGKF